MAKKIESKVDRRRRREGSPASKDGIRNYGDSKNPDFRADFWLTDATGKRIRKFVRAKTHKECKAKIKAATEAAAKGPLQRRGSKVETIGDLMESWLEHWKIQNPQVARKTIDDYERCTALVIKWMGDIKLDMSPPQKIIDAVSQGLMTIMTRGRNQRYSKQPQKPWEQLTQDEQASFRLSNETVRGVRRKLSMACNYGVSNGYLVMNPTKGGVKIENISASEKVTFTNEQLATIGDALEKYSDEIQVRWVLPLSLGLRQGELLGLRWDRIDWNTSTVLINASAQAQPWRHGCDDPDKCGVGLYKPMARARKCPQRHSGGVILRDHTKERDVSRLPLSPGLVSLLKAHRKSQLEARLAAGEKWQDNDLVFCSDEGKPLRSEGDLRRWKAFLAEHGLPVAGTHSARHTGITVAFDEGVDELVVSRIFARHKSGPGFTRSQYQHTRSRKTADDAIREAMERRILGRSATIDPVDAALQASGLTREQLAALLSKTSTQIG